MREWESKNGKKRMKKKEMVGELVKAKRKERKEREWVRKTK